MFTAMVHLPSLGEWYFSQNWWDCLLYSALQASAESLSNNFPIKQTAQRWPSPTPPHREMLELKQFIYTVKPSSFSILHRILLLNVGGLSLRYVPLLQHWSQSWASQMQGPLQPAALRWTAQFGQLWIVVAILAAMGSQKGCGEQKDLQLQVCFHCGRVLIRKVFCAENVFFSVFPSCLA